MPNCDKIDQLVTPYVDGQLTNADRDAVDQHLRRCPPCDSRVTAEQAVHSLIQERRDALTSTCASSLLRAKCREHARRAGASGSSAGTLRASGWRASLAPLAAAASLVLIVGVAF